MIKVIKTHEIKLLLNTKEYEAFKKFFQHGTTDFSFIDTGNPSNPINTRLSSEQAEIFNNIVRGILCQ